MLLPEASSPSRAGAEDTSSQCSREHKQQANYSDRSDFVILTVDLEHAFNNVSRKDILDLVVKRFPQIARWVFWFYGRHSGQDPLL